MIFLVFDVLLAAFSFSLHAYDLVGVCDVDFGIFVPAYLRHYLAVERHEVAEFLLQAVGSADVYHLVSHTGIDVYFVVVGDVYLLNLVVPKFAQA